MKTPVIFLLAAWFSAYCASSQTISGVVNIYTPVLEIHSSTCQPFIVVLDSKGFNVGNKVLIIQMQGALLNLTNTANYGTINDYANSGNHEFARISGISQDTVFLQGPLLKGYTISGKVQLIRVPEYDNVSVKDSVICPPWNGTVGGVIVLDAKETVTLNGNISANGKGFRGGAPLNSVSVPSYHVTDYKGPISQPSFYARKGEGIGGELDGELMGKGAPANGGGGGNNHNGGGGGGANGGCGGNGGYGWKPVYTGDNTQAQGIGGKELLHYQGKFFLGGGGGAGHTNERNLSYGGNGGGIVIIKADSIIGNNFAITSTGNSAPDASVDAAGGGGGGGTILLLINTFTSVNAIANGGKGGDNSWPHGSPIAPGGGGGGGTVLFKQSTTPSNIMIQTLGGKSGVARSSNTKFGSTDGCNGKQYFKATIAENTEGVVKVRQIAVITPTEPVRPGTDVSVVLRIDAGVTRIIGDLQYDSAALKLTGIATATLDWTATASETASGITSIIAAGSPSGGTIVLPMTLFLPPTARQTESLNFIPIIIETADGCDSAESLSGSIIYDPTCSWSIRTVQGNGKQYVLSVHGEKIEYSVGLSSIIRVVLYDALGRLIWILAENHHLAGQYVTLLPDVPSGMYAVRLETALGVWSALFCKY